MRRVAILGGKRIPFARSFSNYMDASIQDLMLGAIRPLVESFKLKDQVLGEVVLGAVINTPPIGIFPAK
jgi:acetyl-CoA C-acetyltransferase